MDSISRTALYPYAVDYTCLLTERSEQPFASGGFSHVYKAKLHGELVAIKELKAIDVVEQSQAEYSLWQHLRHPNILQLKGICYLRDECRVPSFISRWQKNGRIMDFIRERPDIDYPLLIEGVAEAVRYLHLNGIIHGDLRAANILIGDDGKALVTDFGISKQDAGEGIQISKNIRGNYRWMAPELLKQLNTLTTVNNARRTKQSDIWMFGMLIKEILSGAYPYHDVKNTIHVLAKLEAGKLPNFPPAQHDSWKKFDPPVHALSIRCCAIRHEERPAIQDVIKEIRIMRENNSQTDPVPRGPTDNRVNSISTSSDMMNRLLHSRSELRNEDHTVTLARMIGSFRLSTNSTNSSTDNIWSTSGTAGETARTTSSSRPEGPKCSPTTSGETRQAAQTKTVSTICPTIELNNYIMRKRLASRLTDSFESTGPDEQKTWCFIFKLDGKEIARASAFTKADVKKAAAKVVLNKLCGPTLPNRADGLVPDTSSALTPQFHSEGPSHNPTWICTLYNGACTLEGRGLTKKDAQQNARLQLSF